MSERSELRAWACEIRNACWWPNCPMSLPLSDVTPPSAYAVLELAHIQARGMGHTGYQDRKDNVVMLCRWHHRHFDDLEQVSESSRKDLLARVYRQKVPVSQVDADRYVQTGLATKWHRRQWMQAIAAWRQEEAGFLPAGVTDA